MRADCGHHRSRIVAVGLTAWLTAGASSVALAAPSPGGAVDGSVTVAGLVITEVAMPVTSPVAGSLAAVRVTVRNDTARSLVNVAIGVSGASHTPALVASLASGDSAAATVPVWFCASGRSDLSITAVDQSATVTAPPSALPVSVSAGPGCVGDPSVDRSVIRVSRAADRIGPAQLDGRVAAGTIYMFVDPASPLIAGRGVVRRVEFAIDRRSAGTDFRVPFDFLRSPRTAATGFDTTVLADGSHIVTATIVFADGTRRTDTATFIVDNRAAAKVLQYSLSVDRSRAIVLDGASLGGTRAYLFVGPTAPIAGANVAFLLDNRLIKVESVAPYDMGGTARDGTARPVALTGLRRGTYTITVEYRFRGGPTIRQQATFTRP